MDKRYLVPLVTILLLSGLLVFGVYSSSDTTTSNENSFFGDTGNFGSSYQVVEVGGYQFKIPTNFKLSDSTTQNEESYTAYSKSFTNQENSYSLIKIVVYKDFLISAPDFADLFAKRHNTQFNVISIGGHKAYSIVENGNTHYLISVNNDLIAIGINGVDNPLNLVEIILSLVLADSNNSFGGGSQSSDSSSNENNSTDETDFESSDDSSNSNNKNNNRDDKPPNEEPLPPSDDYSSDGSGGWY